MAWGLGPQKFQSQQKKKSKGHDQKAAAKADLVYTCTVCQTQMPDPKLFKQHFKCDLPKDCRWKLATIPPEPVGIEA
uniref:Zinc finger protein 706 n=1 Tax=Neogobius melanostomus TaxID=47308 RepID=A0A8C6TZ39_9GOBI